VGEIQAANSKPMIDHNFLSGVYMIGVWLCLIHKTHLCLTSSVQKLHKGWSLQITYTMDFMTQKTL